MKELIRKILNEEDRRKNKTQQFQKLIDDEIESMKEICKQMSADDEESISFDACDFLDLDPKVIVTDVDKFYGKLRILVIIKYEAAMHFHDEEAFIYELQWRLKWVGNVMIDVEDVITTYPNDKNSGNMNLQESIRRILREEVNSADVKTIESELTNMLGSSKIKNGNRIEFVRIGPFNSSFDVVVDRLDQNTLNYINNFMSEKGWFPTNISLSGMKGRIYSNHVNEYIGEDDVQIGYESNFGKEVNTTQTKAFHVTPDIFMDKIKKTGLTVKSESKLSNHPDRIYLFLNQDKDVPKNMVWTIWNSLSKERQNQIKDYYVLEIDLTKLPNHKFYHDPQSMATYEAIYTNQPIPRSAIKVIDKISTSNIETKDGDVVMSKDEERRAREEKRRKEDESLKQKKEFDANLSKQIQTSKEFDKLPDDLKNMNIDDLFNLEESIRRGIKKIMMGVNESITGDTPTDFTKQFMNKPVKLVGDVNTTTKIQNINVNNDGSVNIYFQNGMKVNSSLPMMRRFNLEVDIPLEFKIRKKGSINESESKTYSSLHRLLNILFDGFDNIDYDWANYMCGMGECCDPYAIGFTLPDKDYDDYIFKLVNDDVYDDNGDYPKEFQDELPEVCYESPDIKNPDFDTIVFHGIYAEEIEDYMGHESNWKSDLLKIINNQFGCDVKRIIII
jgi:hypothetical protein